MVVRCLYCGPVEVDDDDVVEGLHAHTGTLSHQTNGRLDAEMSAYLQRPTKEGAKARFSRIRAQGIPLDHPSVPHIDITFDDEQ